MVLLLFSLFVVLPVGKRGVDIVLLALLAAAANQDDQMLTVLAEIDAVAGAEINLQPKTLNWATRMGRCCARGAVALPSES